MTDFLKNFTKRISPVFRAHRKIFIFAAATGVILFSSIVLYSLNGAGILKLSADISKISQIVPSQSVTEYIEIASPSAFYDEFKKSKPGAQILKAPAWKHFFSGKSFSKINQVIYLMESGTGRMLSLEDFIDFADGPAGYARYADGSFLLVTELDIKSSIGIKLASFFADTKEAEIKEKPPVSPAAEEGENKASDSSKSFIKSYENSTIELGSVIIKQFQNDQDPIYYLISGKYLIASDSKDTLEKSIRCARGDINESVYGVNGFSAVLKNYTKTDILVFKNFDDSAIDVSLKTLFNCENITAVFKLFDSKPYADIFYPGRQDNAAAVSCDWTKILPKDNTLTLTSCLPVNTIISSISESASEGDAKEDITKFFANASINPNAYFATKPGFSVVMNKLTLKNNKLYPDFGFAYNSAAKDSKLLNAFFAAEMKSTEKFQNVSFDTFRGASNAYYTPSFYSTNDYSLIASGKSIVQDFISASNANKPKISDSPGFAELPSDRKDITAQIIVNMPMLMNDIRTFYSYAVVTTKNYSEETVKKDILPLFDVLKEVKSLHMYRGKGGQGKLLIVK